MDERCSEPPERPGSSHGSLGPLPPLATDFWPQTSGWGRAGRDLRPWAPGLSAGQGTEPLVLSTPNWGPPGAIKRCSALLPPPPWAPSLPAFCIPPPDRQPPTLAQHALHLSPALGHFPSLWFTVISQPEGSLVFKL